MTIRHPNNHEEKTLYNSDGRVNPIFLRIFFDVLKWACLDGRGFGSIQMWVDADAVSGFFIMSDDAIQTSPLIEPRPIRDFLDRLPKFQIYQWVFGVVFPLIYIGVLDLLFAFATFFESQFVLFFYFLPYVLVLAASLVWPFRSAVCAGILHSVSSALILLSPLTVIVLPVFLVRSIPDLLGASLEGVLGFCIFACFLGVPFSAHVYLHNAKQVLARNTDAKWVRGGLFYSSAFLSIFLWGFVPACAYIFQCLGYRML